jgi:hypothetical protein
MSRVVLLLVLTLATVTAVVLVRARAHERTDLQPAEKSSQSNPSPSPLILQEGDGDHLVHSAGPLIGLPLLIKLDGQFGNTQDFFVFTEILAAGQTIPFHKHENAEELLISEEGGATVIVQAGGGGAPFHRFHPARHLDFSYQQRRKRYSLNRRLLTLWIRELPAGH